MIIRTTKTPPNVTKNIPKEVSCGGDGGWRRGCVVKVILVGLTEPAIVIDAEDLRLVAEILSAIGVRFGEVIVLTLLSEAKLQFEPGSGGLEEKLVGLDNVLAGLGLSWPAIKVIISSYMEPLNKECNLNSNYMSCIVYKTNILSLRYHQQQEVK